VVPSFIEVSLIGYHRQIHFVTSTKATWVAAAKDSSCAIDRGGLSGQHLFAGADSFYQVFGVFCFS
jgi:hypothetical protein